MKQLLLTVLAFAVALTGKAQVTVPADATTESWMCSFVMHSNTAQGETTERVSETMDVAFSGQDVYFNLPNPISGNTWVKGAVSGTTATFASGQLLGNYGGNVYMVGQDEQGLCDLVFNYDADRGRFTLSNMQLVLSASATSIDAWAYYTDLTVSKGGEVQNEDGTVAPPADAVVEDWTLTCRNVNPSNESQYEDVAEPVQVAFSGDQIYIQGLCPASGWLKGTVSDGKAVFAARQYLGTAQGYAFYAIGFEGEDAIDIVFSYDAERGVLQTDSYILMISADDYVIMELTNVALNRSDGTTPTEELVTPPADLVTSEYVLKATSVQYNADGSIASMEPVQWNVRVGFSGKEVYVQGLCNSFMPTAWVKGVLDDGDVTFANGQFLGAHPQLPSMKFYFCSTHYQEITDMVMEYNSQEGTLRGYGYYMLINSEKNVQAPYEVYVGITISRVSLAPATPATPEVAGYEAYYEQEGLARVFFNLPTTDVDGNAIDRGRMSYRVYYQTTGSEPAVYTFSAPLYENLTESMTEVPYFFSDGWDFFLGGTAVYLYESQSWQRIGVQTVYTVPGSTTESAVAWLDISTQGIADTSSAGATVVSEQCFDLQGRPVSAASARGLVVRQQRLSDGTVRTVKMKH